MQGDDWLWQLDLTSVEHALHVGAHMAAVCQLVRQAGSLAARLAELLCQHGKVGPHGAC